MNPDVSRRAARAVQNAPLIPDERRRIADAVELVDSWEALPADVRSMLEEFENAPYRSQAEAGEELLRRWPTADDDRHG